MNLKRIRLHISQHLYILVFTLFILNTWQVTSATTDKTRNPKWATKVENISLDNMYRVDEGIYRCEQPKKNEFPVLEEFGIKEILNLRKYHDNEDEAEGTNIALHQIKISAHHIKKESIVEALKIIRNRKENILIHCQHGSDRTGLTVAMYRIVFQNWTKEEAIDEMKNGGYGYHKIYINIVRFIKKADIEDIRKQIGLD